MANGVCVGDYAGRHIILRINGDVVFEGARTLAPEGVSWRIWPPLGGEAARFQFEIEPCSEPLSDELAEGASTIIVRDCRLEIVEG